MSIPTFDRGLGLEERPQHQPRPFEQASLPLAQKEDLCKALLDEFGIGYRQNGVELIHGCRVSNVHTNQDTSPTASLNYEKLVFKCLGCGASGGLLWFISVMRGCDVDEARAWLEQETGLGGATMDLSALLRYLDAVYQNRSTREPIPVLSEKILEPWVGIHPYLTDPKATGYGRGIPYANCEAARVGYAERYVVGHWPDGSEKTSERIVIPHFWKGDLVGWQTRRLLDTDGTPKYLSSADFPKNETIYNYRPGAERVIVVEAMLSAISKMHLAHVEATFGASVTDTQVSLLEKHPEVILFMDNDEAGWSAVAGKDTYNRQGRLVKHTPGLAELLSRSCLVRVVDNPWDADAADLDDHDFQKLVESAVPWQLWKRPQVLLRYTGGLPANDVPCK